MSKTFSFVSRGWFQILGIGALLFLGSEQALKYTNNPNYVPTVILLGAFVVPAAFIAYFATQERSIDKNVHSEMPMSLVAILFLVGGVIGSVVAGLVEYQTLRNLAVPNLFTVAVIEEAAKMIFPLGLYIFSKYKSEADGLLIGIVSGMSFAALETMGYGLVALLNTQGNVGTLEEVLLIRGLLSPVGHAAWTGLVCGFLWGQRAKTGKSFNLIPVGVFVLVVALHGLWDLAGSFNLIGLTYISYIAIGAIGLTLLALRLRDAKRTTQMETPLVS